MTESANVELVRRGFAMFQREGPEAVAAIFALADPEIECHAAPGIEPTGTYRGKQAAMRWAREWFDAWTDFKMEPADLIEIGDHAVVVPLHQVAMGKRSGVQVEIDLAYVFEIRNGRITRFHLYPDMGQAIAVAEGFGRG